MGPGGASIAAATMSKQKIPSKDSFFLWLASGSLLQAMPKYLLPRRQTSYTLVGYRLQCKCSGLDPSHPGMIVGTISQNCQMFPLLQVTTCLAAQQYALHPDK
jgi:hypothetical protein